MAFTKRFDDAFTEASDVNLEDHTPTTSGVSWTASAGNFAANLGQVFAAEDAVSIPFHSGASEHQTYYADISGSWEDKQKASCTMQSNLPRAGPMVRGQDHVTSDDPDGYTLKASADNQSLYRIDEHAITELASETNFGHDSSTVLAILIDGSSITVEFDDVEDETFSVTDANHSGGSPGVALLRSGTVGVLDNYKAYDEAAAAGGIEVLRRRIEGA